MSRERRDIIEMPMFEILINRLPLRKTTGVDENFGFHV